MILWHRPRTVVEFESPREGHIVVQYQPYDTAPIGIAISPGSDGSRLHSYELLYIHTSPHRKDHIRGRINQFKRWMSRLSVRFILSPSNGRRFYTMDTICMVPQRKHIDLQPGALATFLNLGFGECRLHSFLLPAAVIWSETDNYLYVSKRYTETLLRLWNL
jgi:hypothetical protein